MNKSEGLLNKSEGLRPGSGSCFTTVRQCVLRLRGLGVRDPTSDILPPLAWGHAPMRGVAGEIVQIRLAAIISN